jgi:hypothetical protein
MTTSSSASLTSSSNLRSLQREWDAKLKASGFVDLERSLTGEHQLEPIFRRVARRRHDRFAAIADGEAYFRSAGLFLAAHDFSQGRWAQPRDKEVWARHADGESLIVIARATGISRKAVEKIVARLAKELRRTLPQITAPDDEEGTTGL